MMAGSDPTTTSTNGTKRRFVGFVQFVVQWGPLK